ncbi:hypothetical protein BEH94_00320 [Candidatus Altiarchaeales archaeon WOR_SM1_SCG]|nr:hypothetical protein BEH94_00320 [Candidatus Altiarchaeales archaeon WOR_SM1_SCG]
MNKNYNYDVVIVGAGPAGSTCARHLAENNIKVLVVEKKQEIGTPKRCAEGLNYRGLKNAGLEPDPRWATSEIQGVSLYSPGEKNIEMKWAGAMGCVLERKIFEKFLARDAINAGARYMVKTRAIEVLKENGKISGIKAEFMGKEFNINAKLVIAADGVESGIAKSAGIKTLNKLTDYISGFQYEMAGLKNYDENLLHVFFGNEVAPKGYAWIFPKGEGVANIGIGILGKESSDKNRAKDYLDKFIEKHPGIFEDASPIEINAGGVPVSSAVETFVADNFMIIGDSAQLVNPIHGGGIDIAMNSAKIAAGVAAEALKEGDLSKEKLYGYEKTWRETTGVKMQKLLRLRMVLEKLTDNDFELLADVLSGEDIVKLTVGKFKFLLKLLSKNPRTLLLLRKFI